MTFVGATLGAGCQKQDRWRRHPRTLRRDSTSAKKTDDNPAATMAPAPIPTAAIDWAANPNIAAPAKAAVGRASIAAGARDANPQSRGVLARRMLLESRGSASMLRTWALLRTLGVFGGSALAVPPQGRVLNCNFPDTLCGQLASAIAQPALQTSAVPPDRRCKALSPRTRQHACDILQSAESSALLVAFK